DALGVLLVLVGNGGLDHFGSAGGFAAGSQHLLVEDFTRAVLFARDVSGDLDVRQVLVDFRPLLVGVGDKLAVDDDFSGEREVDVLRLELQVGIAAVGGEDDAVIADLDFLDLGDAGSLAGLDFAALHRARRIGDVDGVRADALAEFLEAAAGAAGFDDRRLEVRIGFAKRFGDDLGVRKNSGRAGDLDLVARNGNAGEGC